MGHQRNADHEFEGLQIAICHARSRQAPYGNDKQEPDGRSHDPDIDARESSIPDKPVGTAQKADHEHNVNDGLPELFERLPALDPLSQDNKRSKSEEHAYARAYPRDVKAKVLFFQ